MTKYIIVSTVFLTLTIVLAIYYFYKAYKYYKEIDEDSPVEHLISKISITNFRVGIAFLWAGFFQYLNIEKMILLIEITEKL